MSQVYNPEMFGKALKQLAEGDKSPYIHIARARKHLEEANLHPLAYGIINIPLVSNEYENSRTFLFDNVDKGTKNLSAVIKGLNKVAANNKGAEQANMILPGDVKIEDIKVEESNVDIVAEAAAMYSLKIGVMAALTGGISATAKWLAITAGAAAAIWALFVPDDAALEKAQAHWKEAGKELQDFDEKLVAIMTDFGDAWRGDAAEAFKAYIERFKNEVGEVREAVETGEGSIDAVHKSLDMQQHQAFLMAVANLVVLIAMEIASWSFPPSRPAWKVAMNIVGALFSITSGSMVAAMTGALKTVGLAIYGLASATFVTEKKGDGDELDENGVDFEEVALSQEDINTLVSDAE